MAAYTPKQIEMLRRRHQLSFRFVAQARLQAPKTFERKFKQYAKAAGLNPLELRAKLAMVDWTREQAFRDLVEAKAKVFYEKST